MLRALAAPRTMIATACRSLHQPSRQTTSTTFQDTTCIGLHTATTARKPRHTNGCLSVDRAPAATNNMELLNGSNFATLETQQRNRECSNPSTSIQIQANDS